MDDLFNKAIYVSPQKNFIIVTREWKNSVWGDIFYGVLGYYICKKQGDEWVILAGDLSLTDCFRLLYNNNIISKDEMQREIANVKNKEV